jgi:tetratricopeptide (TPR) repeat protein
MRRSGSTGCPGSAPKSRGHFLVCERRVRDGQSRPTAYKVVSPLPPTAALLVTAGSVVVSILFDVCGSRLVLACDWHGVQSAARTRVPSGAGAGLRVLNSRNSLAVAYQDAGRLDEAITLHEQTLAARERVLGLYHPDTLSSQDNLAVAYQDAGRLDEAITLHEQTLAAHERVQSPDHPDTLTSRNNLANAYQAAGRTGESSDVNAQPSNP